MTRKHFARFSPFRFAENIREQSAGAMPRALAALPRMRHDCGKSNNEAATRARRDKGGHFR
jgi:hypothetical protein